MDEDGYAFRQTKRLQIVIAAFIFAAILSVSVTIAGAAYVITEEQATSQKITDQVEANRVALIRLNLTKVVLCAQQENLKARVAQSEDRVARARKYIRDVLAGRRVPIGGITLDEIRAGIGVDETLLRNQKATIKVYDRLECPR